MRVGVELMMTNISAAKSSLRPSKMMQGTRDGGRVLRPLLHVEMQRGEAVLAVDDQELGARVGEVAAAPSPSERNCSFSLV